MTYSKILVVKTIFCSFPYIWDSWNNKSSVRISFYIFTNYIFSSSEYFLSYFLREPIVFIQLLTKTNPVGFHHSFHVSLIFLNSFQTHFIKWHRLKTVIFFLRWKLHLHSHSEYCFFCATYWSTRTMIYVHVLYMDNFKKVKIYPKIWFLWWFRLVNLLW